MGPWYIPFLLIYLNRISYESLTNILHKDMSKCFDFLLGYNIQNLRVMSEPLDSVLTEQIDFFPGAFDIILLVVALVSTLSTFCLMQFPYWFPASTTLRNSADSIQRSS